jgi:hypothetical protein
MPCFHPLEAARPTGSEIVPLIYAKGRRPQPLAKGWEELQLPCGQCIGCRLERSRVWAVRIMHEAQLHENNAFITLTYDDEHLPIDGALDVNEFQLFMKKLRKVFAVPKENGDSGQNDFSHDEKDELGRKGKVRYFHCGEYGDQFSRPHYHACLFGVSFPDQKLLKRVRENAYYTSEILERTWGNGYAVIGELTFESAAYVARYCVKKINGKNADEHYTRDNPITGIVRRLPPEYATMSLKPGIGAGWLQEYVDDVYPWDEVIVNGHPTKPPRYYDKLYELDELEAMELIRRRREKDAKRRAKDNTPARLHAREKVKLAQAKQLTRRLEDETLPVQYI